MSRQITRLEKASARSHTAVELRTVPPGYMRTEAGVIPIDWKLWPVHRMGEVLTGKALAVNGPGKQRPYLRTRNVFDGRIDIEDVLTMPMTDTQFEHFKLRYGDVLLNEGQSLELVGRCAIYRDEYPEACAIQNQLLRFRAGRGVCADFAAHLFRYCQKNGVFARVALQTTSIAHLGGSRFERLSLPWPETEDEQRAIAEALSDVDGSIGALETLIAKKRAVKQAVMQQLLTCKTRLPGFRGKWEVKRLGNCLTFLKNGANSRAELSNDGDVRYLHYGDIHGSRSLLLNPIKTPMPYLSHTKAGQLDRLKDGDLIFADASEDLDGVGKSIEIKGVENVELVSGLHTIAIRFDKAVLADGFKVYLQFIPSFRAHLRQLAAGTKIYATNRAHIASAEVALPLVDEQTAIATVLSDMDAEIDALDRWRNKTRQIKQGMIQQLLTGRIRLVEPGVTASEKAMAQTGARQANVHFIRSVLAAEIIDQLHEQATFGHVKFEKMMFLVEHLCEVETGSSYRRMAAGPYDNRALRSIDSQLRAQQWFDARKEGKRYQYVPMRKRGEHKRYFDRYFSGIGKTFDRVLGAFKTLDTERCEIVATLLAAWNDLLCDRGTVSDDLIVHEVLNNWHEAKRRIPEDRWLKALVWMRGQGFVPKGAA